MEMIFKNKNPRDGEYKDPVRDCQGNFQKLSQVEERVNLKKNTWNCSIGRGEKGKEWTKWLWELWGMTSSQMVA